MLSIFTTGLVVINCSDGDIVGCCRCGDVNVAGAFEFAYDKTRASGNPTNGQQMAALASA